MTDVLHGPDPMRELQRTVISARSEAAKGHSEAKVARQEVATLTGRLFGFDGKDRGEFGDLRVQIRRLSAQMWTIIVLLLSAMAAGFFDLLSRVH